MQNYFIITTCKDVAEKIENLSRSDAFLNGRSLKIGKICHHEGFSDVQIISTKENGLIEPQDIFWLGHFSV
jgi:hypothetical protein